MTTAVEHHLGHCRVRGFTLAVGCYLEFFPLYQKSTDVIFNTSMEKMVDKFFF
jgi:hypothetical protein